MPTNSSDSEGPGKESQKVHSAKILEQLKSERTGTPDFEFDRSRGKTYNGVEDEIRSFGRLGVGTV